MISKYKMKLKYHDTCATALEAYARNVTTLNSGWNASQKEVNMLREFMFSEAMKHRDKARQMIETQNARKENASNKVPA